MGKQTNYSPTFPQYPAGAFAITASDTVNLQNVAIVYVGTGGTIKVTTANGDVVTFTGVATGTVLPVQVLRVWAATLTASGLVGIY
ncbi:MAG: hypothetical protein WCO52_06040 [bacterium]|jgi:hypothetical protein